MAQPIEQENVTQNTPDGALFGFTSTKLIAFYGATPVDRTITASTNSVSTTTTVSLSTAGAGAATMWGFATQTEIVNYVTAVSTMQLAMKQLGIISS
mgnify:CR=1 FL=1